MPEGSPADPPLRPIAICPPRCAYFETTMSGHEVIVPLNALPAPRDTFARPMRDLRISVMDRCNFRCPYCMPRETYHEQYRFLGSHERLSFDEIVRLARLFVQLGVRKLRLTGGEPLLRANLPDLVGDLTTIAGVEDVALTTNGVLLARYASELKAAGLKRVTVSLDSLDAGVFARMSGGLGRPGPLAALEPGYRGEVARRYAFTDGAGEVGFISSVSQPFCGDCSRARLSSDGALYTCLFATHGTSLRDALRGGASDDALLELIRGVWLQRADRYSELRASRHAAPHEQRKVEMVYIGG